MRNAALYEANKTTLFGSLKINNTTPGNPEIILWNKMTFIAGPIIAGPTGPYQAYYQSSSTLSVPLGGVTPPPSGDPWSSAFSSGFGGH